MVTRFFFLLFQTAKSNDKNKIVASANNLETKNLPNLNVSVPLQQVAYSLSML